MSTNTRPSIDELLQRITYNPDILGGKPTIRGRRYAVEHVLMQLARGDTPELLLEGHPWLELEDIQACLMYAYSIVCNERFMPRYAKDPQ
jgi:uncharacterized protein (DUF433 family)